MGRTYDVIDEHHRAFVERQHLFFVASAPLSADGHVNVSPKGPGGTFRILGERRVAYLDYTGSGAETVAHLRENGRIVIMFCAFEGPPKILRFHGTGQILWAGDEGFEALRADAGFDELSISEAERAIVVVDVDRISTSCGYGVPLMSFEGTRPHYDKSKRKRLRTQGVDGLLRHQVAGNQTSIDGLPAVDGDLRLDDQARPVTR